jgi:hypothetical protein
MNRYEVCKKSIQRYIDKNPEALKIAKKKYVENNKERLREYKQEYDKWKQYINNTSWKYEKQLYLQILI